jgi:uncharacterized membrane protein
MNNETPSTEPPSLATEARAAARRRTLIIVATVCFVMLCVCGLAFGVLYLVGATWPSTVVVLAVAATGLALSWLIIRRA